MKRYIILLTVFACISLNGYAQIENRWRIHLSGGSGKMFDNKPECGIQGSTDIHFLFHQNLGIGMKYAFFSAEGNWEHQETIDRPSLPSLPPLPPMFANVEYQVNRSINYVGPSLYANVPIVKSKLIISAVLSVGNTYCKSKESVTVKNIQSGDETGESDGSFFGSSDGNIKIVDIGGSTSPNNNIFIPDNKPFTETAFGSYAGIGAEYFLNKSISIGAGCGYFNSFCEKAGKLSRIDFSLTFNIYFNHNK
ncbi:MAG: hypothetical protein LBH32_13955 [Dysgonamonadaceae bacterium]|jgi:hypothetical protein|nr:hypothetical protein [Dysgonamonadaceae bacterium]